MAATNCIASHLFEQSKPPLPYCFPNGRSHGAAVRVQTHAIQLDVVVVQQKSSIDVKADGAHSERCFCRVRNLAIALKHLANGIKIGRVCRPKCRRRYFYALGKNKIAICVNRSEEHTSELQSLRHLVCRLLLEK